MFERVLNALLWCQEFIPSSSNNELIMYPLNFKLSRTWLHKSCIVFKTTCDYWGKLIELALHMLYESAVNYTTPNEGYNGNVALQMLYESGVDYTTPNEEYSGNVWYYKWQSHSWIAW